MTRSNPRAVVVEEAPNGMLRFTEARVERLRQLGAHPRQRTFIIESWLASPLEALAGSVVKPQRTNFCSDESPAAVLSRAFGSGSVVAARRSAAVKATIEAGWFRSPTEAVQAMRLYWKVRHRPKKGDIKKLRQLERVKKNPTGEPLIFEKDGLAIEMSLVPDKGRFQVRIYEMPSDLEILGGVKPTPLSVSLHKSPAAALVTAVDGLMIEPWSKRQSMLSLADDAVRGSGWFRPAAKTPALTSWFVLAHLVRLGAHRRRKTAAGTTGSEARAELRRLEEPARALLAAARERQ